MNKGIFSLATPASGISYGRGGLSANKNIVLTNSMTGAITVAPPVTGMFATLPDARTCIKSSVLFSIYNAGDGDYGVKDATGTYIGWLRPRTGCVIGLSDNTTLSGSWVPYGLEKVGVTAQYSDMVQTGMASARVRQVTLDANRTCILVGTTVCYAIVYDASISSWGSLTLVKSTIVSSMFAGIKSATDQVLVCYQTSGTVGQCVTLTITGTTVTVNTPVAITFGASSFNDFQRMVVVPAQNAFVMIYCSSVYAYANAISVSGTVPSPGAATSNAALGAASALNSLAAFVQGSVVRYITTSAPGQVTPLTISGNTISVGTAATFVTVNIGKMYVNGLGNIVILYKTGTNYAAAVSKLVGTTETITTVTPIGSANPSTAMANLELIPLTANTSLVVMGSGGFLDAGILTDNAGTVSMGTLLQFTTWPSTNITQVCVAGVSGTSVRVIVTTPTNCTEQITFETASGTPVVSSMQSLTSPNVLNLVISSDNYLNRSPTNLSIGNVFYALAGNSTSIYDLKFTPQYISRMSPLPAPVPMASGSDSITIGNNGDSWFGGTYSTSPVGLIIQRIEIAA
jgi:hypothetical protein